MVIATWASRSFAFRMQAVSCEISARSENELSDGIYPSAIAQRVRPMASMSGEPPVTRALAQRGRRPEVPQNRVGHWELFARSGVRLFGASPHLCRNRRRDPGVTSTIPAIPLL